MRRILASIAWVVLLLVPLPVQANDPATTNLHPFSSNI